MKRISIAEQTLKHQIELLTDKMNDLIDSRTEINTQIGTIESIITELSIEQDRLRYIRESASVRTTPPKT